MRNRTLLSLSVGLAVTAGFATWALCDLDVGIPPGSPLEWDKLVPKPVPTGARGTVPTVDPADVKKLDDARVAAAAPAGAPGAAPGNVVEGGTTATAPPPQLEFGVTNLYDYFKVLTVDIMNHLKVNIPEPKKSRPPVQPTTTVSGPEKPDGSRAEGGDAQAPPAGAPAAPAAPGGDRPKEIDLAWNYQPDHPTELVWAGIAAALRVNIHPEAVSFPESVAHLAELGPSTVIGADAASGMLADAVRARIAPMPDGAPAIPKGDSAYRDMLNRLAVLELTAGHPHALDPTYAKRTLALGKESLPSILACAESKHLFLRQNAAAALADFEGPEAAAALRKLAESGDLTTQVRALKALFRRRDASLVDPMIRLMQSKDPVMSALGTFGLGILGDTRAAEPLRDAISARAGDLDFLWTAVPALARIPDRDPKNLSLLEKLKAAVEQGAAKGAVPNNANNPPAPGAAGAPPPPANGALTQEAPGTKKAIVLEMILVARAAHGDAAAKTDLVDKLKKDGMKGVWMPTWYVLIDTLVDLGPEGKERLLAIASETDLAPVARVYALHRLAGLRPDPAAIRSLAEGSGDPAVRAAALLALAELQVAAAVDVAKSIVSRYGSGSGAIDAGEAFVVATALQVGGKVKAFDTATLQAAVRRAFLTEAYARREGNNDPDITKASIVVFPPLLESAVLELGRTADPSAVAGLQQVLSSTLPWGRAEAALALGGVGGKSAADALLGGLADPDGWVRFCSYKSLKRLTGQDFFTDWIFNKREEVEPVIKMWRDYVAANVK